MILFANRAAQHIAKKIQLQHGDYVIKNFTDGELFVRINEDLSGKHIWVIASTQPPAENLIELFFLLDALQRVGANIHLIFTYFAYARQIIAAPGEAHSTQIICDILTNFTSAQTLIVHPHSALLHELLSFKAIYDLDFFCEQAKEYDVIAAPDEGALPFAQKVAQHCNKELVTLTKMRPEQEEVAIVSMSGDVKNKKILLVDDIISTGRTLIAAAHALKKQGAVIVSAAATHGIFSPGSRERIENSILEKVYVTNTIFQQSHGKIRVIDISKTLAKIMQ